MSRWQRRGRAAAALVTLVAVVWAGSACTGAAVEGGEESSAAADDRITLVVDVFGDVGFGYEQLYEQYMELHPEIVIEQRGVGLDATGYHTRLAEWITSGSGAGDVVAVSGEAMVQYRGRPDGFVDLLDYGAGDLESEYLAWKWQEGTVAGNGPLIGLGADVGSMAMCYRSDLFAAAGLPTERAEVAAMWQTWADYVEVGRLFAEQNPSVSFVDAASNLYDVVLTQLAGANTGYTYFDRDDRLALADNPDVAAAWATAVGIVESGLSAGLRANSDAWNDGFETSAFATLACPSWMAAAIKDLAGEDGAGRWDIAQAPGTGGNWGGSYLAVPAQSSHPEQAAALAMYLTGAEGQVTAFGEVGGLPSNVTALQDPAVAETTDDYFNDAPVGQLYAAGATAMQPVYLGPKDQAVGDAVENALRSIEQGHRTAEEAWQDAMTNGTSAGS